MRKAQSTLEYAVVIVSLVAALLAIQVYAKRAMQGRLRQIADELGQQYAPKNTTSDITISSSGTTTTKVETTEDTTGSTKKTLTTTTTYSGPTAEHPEYKPEKEERSGNETVGKLESSLY